MSYYDSDTAPTGDYSPEKKDERHFCSCILNLCLQLYFRWNTKFQTESFNGTKIWNLRPEHLECYSSFSYCTCSSVYWVFWSSGRVVDCIHIYFFRSSTTGQNIRYQTMRTIWKAWITFKMLCPQILNFVHMEALIFCTLFKASIISNSFHPLFQEKKHFISVTQTPLNSHKSC